MQLALYQRHDTECIPTIGLVALRVVDLTSVAACLCSTPTLAVDVLSTECVLVLVVLGRDGVTILLYTNGITCSWVLHTTTGTSPSESTNAKTLDRHYPETTDDIFAVVLILLVHTLTVVDTNLVVEQTASVSVGE